jgi:2-dehydropantoate 2-reductase
MRIAVFGAGGIGGFIAGALARAGQQMCVVARGTHLEAIRSGGLRVQSELGDFTAQVAASDDLRAFSNLDYVLITFKSHQWHAVLPQFRDAVASDAVFVTLQNGLPFWYERDRALESVDPAGRILRTIPYERIIGGVVHASGHIVRPGAIEQSGGLLYPIGELDGRVTPRIERLAAAFAGSQLHAPIESEIRRNIWKKLVNNLALNQVSALTRATVAAMIGDPRVRALLRSIIDEGLSVARASGVEPGVDAEERLRWAEHIADVKTSMLRDVEAGKPLELEPIAGAVVELADRYGLGIPNTRAVYALTKLLEASVR